MSLDDIQIPNTTPPIKDVNLVEVEDGVFGFEYDTEEDAIEVLEKMPVRNKNAPLVWERRGRVLIIPKGG